MTTTTDVDDTVDTTTDDGRSKARVLADVRSIARQLERAEAKRDALYARRADLFHEARAMPDRATQAALAEAAGVSETVVINTLRKVRPDA